MRIIQRWTKFICYIGIIGTVSVLILWSAAITIIFMDGRPLIYFMHQYKFQFLNVEFNWNWNMQEMDRGLEYLKQSANLVAMGIKIIVLLALSILISAIIINKENKLERIDKQR